MDVCLFQLVNFDRSLLLMYPNQAACRKLTLPKGWHGHHSIHDGVESFPNPCMLWYNSTLKLKATPNFLAWVAKDVQAANTCKKKTHTHRLAAGSSPPNHSSMRQGQHGNHVLQMPHRSPPSEVLARTKLKISEYSKSSKNLCKSKAGGGGLEQVWVRGWMVSMSPHQMSRNLSASLRYLLLLAVA